MRNIGLVTTPRLKLSFSLQLFVWRYFLNICSIIYSFVPYIRIQIIFFHHSCSHLLERPVLPLCHTIFLWCVGDRMLHLDATFFTDFLQNIFHILFYIINPKDFDLSPTSILNHGFPNLESLKDFRFDFEKVNPEKT